MDNCTAHPNIKSLNNIRLEFLPPNTTSLIQPLDQSIIKNLKTFYRKELIQKIKSAVDDNLVDESVIAIDISFKFRFSMLCIFLLGAGGL